MVQLKHSERRILEDALDMRGGYVLDFSNRTFEEFFEDQGIEIYQEKYEFNGTSKANHMRAFTQVEDAVTVCRVLRQLWEYRESIPSNAQNDTSGQLKAKFFAVLDRLEGDRTVTAHGVDEHRAEDAEAAEEARRRAEEVKAAEEAARAPKVFINYRREDSAAYARLVQDRLEREWGRDFVFMDVDSIPIGADFVEILGNEVGKCDVLLALMGHQWWGVRDQDGNRRLDNPNDFVRVEIATALQRDIRVIPILLDGTRVPNEDQLPEDLRGLVRRNGLNVRHESFHNDMDKLIRVVAARAVAAVPRDGAIIFRDLVGKLKMLRITCDKCGRHGQYRVDRLVAKYGIDAKLFDWSDEITADCARKIARNDYDPCGARCPDLSKVV
jgi:hypothetical protein